VSTKHKGACPTATQGLGREASAVAREQYTKPLGWGTTLSKTRAAREQPSPGPTPSVNVLCFVYSTLFCVWLLIKSCFASAAHEDIVVTEALREVSDIGKEVIDGNCAVTVVSVSIVMDNNVFPSRNSTRIARTICHPR